jgi:anti-anti-sigma factor
MTQQTQKSIIDVQHVEGVVVGRIHCPTVGEREAPIIKDEALREAKLVGFKLALDFSEVTMMGSLALGTLVTISKECTGGGGRLALFGLNNNLNEVLKMTRLDKLLPIFKDEATALKKIR